MVTGSGAPTASMVYKLVEVDGVPVEKRSSHKESHGGRKQAPSGWPRQSGTIVEEVVHPADRPPPIPPELVGAHADHRVRPRAVSPSPISPSTPPATGCSQGLRSLPWDGLTLSKGDPAMPTRMIPPARAVGPPWGVARPRSPSCWPPRSPRWAVPSRQGQIEMAEAVAQAFDSGEHLAVQAGTGTGKSLAYLVPAIARSLADERPVVVSTATIALQRQLVDRDLPRLADSLTARCRADHSSRCSKAAETICV